MGAWATAGGLRYSEFIVEKEGKGRGLFGNSRNLLPFRFRMMYSFQTRIDFFMNGN